ncbi:MAG: hypothetical protein IJB80_04920 [Clostridia bacterium]|nr:hypothetical protein [Clostridia bacterium]
MTNFNCSCTCRIPCLVFALIASFIIGTITAFLRFAAVITVGPAFLWVVLGIAVGYLAILLAKTPFFGDTCMRGCNICAILSAILTGILGTIFTAAILLAVEFAATSILGAILTGVLLFFVPLFLTGTVCLIKCMEGCIAD